MTQADHSGREPGALRRYPAAMELKWIQSLVRLMTKAELTELEIEDHNAGRDVW